jgi:hypothetical protein
MHGSRTLEVKEEWPYFSDMMDYEMVAETRTKLRMEV